MNVALEQGKPFSLDFEHGVLEWKESEIRPTNEHSFGDHNLERAKKKKINKTNSKAGSKIKFTRKYLTKANPGYLQDGFILIKISMTNNL